MRRRKRKINDILDFPKTRTESRAANRGERF